MSARARVPHAEFMRIWEEGYVYDSIEFELMHFRMLLVLDGAPLRRADGRLDRELVLRWAAWVAGSRPFYRQRLQRGVFGLTTPAWVPDEHFDLANHVLFTEEVIPLEGERVGELTGRADGPLSIAHPLWRFRVTELSSGEVAIGLTFQHGSFDGQGGMKLLTEMTHKRPDEALEPPGDPVAGQRAARAVELPLMALRAWRRSQPSRAAGWREYWSTPLVRRVRRAGGRVLRPFRDGEHDDREVRVPARHSDCRTLDAARVARHAGELGGTVSDLLAAATIRAYGGFESTVSLRYPVSPLASTPGRARNQITDFEVYGSPFDQLTELVPAIRGQLSAASDDPSSSTGGAADIREIGFTTVLPWVSSPRYVMGAEIRQAIPFAVAQSHDDISAAAVMYNGGLHVGVTMRQSRDVTAVTQLLCGLMTGELSDVPI